MSFVYSSEQILIFTTENEAAESAKKFLKSLKSRLPLFMEQKDLI